MSQAAPTRRVPISSLRRKLVAAFGSAALVLVVGGYVTRRVLKQPGPKRIWHARLLTLPLAGPLVRRADLARFSDTLAILVGAGVPILRALVAARDTMSNVVLRDVVDEAIVRVREGASLSRALRPPRGQRGEFPPVLLNLIASGEATGKTGEHQAVHLPSSLS